MVNFFRKKNICNKYIDNKNNNEICLPQHVIDALNIIHFLHLLFYEDMFTAYKHKEFNELYKLYNIPSIIEELEKIYKDKIIISEKPLDVCELPTFPTSYYDLLKETYNKVKESVLLEMQNMWEIQQETGLLLTLLRVFLPVSQK